MTSEYMLAEDKNVPTNFDRWAVADSFEVICYRLAAMVASYDPIARKVILRESDDFRNHCVGWEDESLLDELPKQMATVCRFASRKKKTIPIKIN